MTYTPEQESARTTHIRAALGDVVGRVHYQPGRRGEYKYFNAAGECISTLSLGGSFNAFDDDEIFEACVSRISRLMHWRFDEVYAMLATDAMNAAPARQAVRARDEARRELIERLDSQLLIGAQRHAVKVVELERSLHDFTGLLEPVDPATRLAVLAAKAADQEVLLCYKGDVQSFFVHERDLPNDGMSGRFSPCEVEVIDPYLEG